MKSRKSGLDQVSAEDVEEYKKYETVEKWMTILKSDLSDSEKTQDGYMRDLIKFCGWAKMNPDQLISERKSDLRSGSEDLEMRAEDRLRKYTAFLKDTKLGKGSVYRMVSSVRSFYLRVYPRGRIVSKAPKSKKKSTTVAVDQNITLKVAQAGTRLQRAATLTVYQGMFRPITLEKMPAKVILDAIETGEVPCHIHVEEEWNKGEEVAYDTFIDKDAIDALSVLTGINPNEPIFGKSDNIGRLVRDAVKNANLPKGVKVNARVLRSSGASRMRTMGVPESHVEVMQGHVLKYGGAYANFPIEDLLKSYKKADMNIFGVVNEKVKISQLNKAKKEFAETIRNLAEVMRNQKVDMLGAIIALCEEATRELRTWNPLEESTPFIEVLKEVMSEPMDNGGK